MKPGLYIWIMLAASALMLSLPWLVPGLGFISLIAFVPLLFAEEAASRTSDRHFFWKYYLCFILWNAFTTFWVCNATVGGGVFAVLANALQMAVIFAVFRFSRRKFRGCIPYILLSATWIAWERWYFGTQISWPWLTLGYAFAGSPRWIQWYEYTGTLGGSLWIWASNLCIYGVLLSLASGSWRFLNRIAKTASLVGLASVLLLPPALSLSIGAGYGEKSEGEVDVCMAQPNFDPYEKFSSLNQKEQNAVLLDLFRESSDSSSRCLFVAPETFTADIVNSCPEQSPTWREFKDFLLSRPESGILFGASTYDITWTRSAPSVLARRYGEGWIESRNSALLMDVSGRTDIYHKSKLVVGTELTPYPKIFVPIEEFLCRKLGMYSLMGRCKPQEKVSLLHFDRIPIGCAVCYESVYGEHCASYVKEGAELLAVITNDAWWGDTPGYRQHLNYSRVRAIELRRDIVRCANTGISAFIDQKGDILQSSLWWKRCSLSGKANLNSEKTFFAEHGDVPGRVCTLVFLLLFLLLVVRTVISRKG